MTELTRLDAESDVDKIVEIIQSDGALILENVLTREQVDQALTEIMPYVEATKPGADDFSGRLHITLCGQLRLFDIPLFDGYSLCLAVAVDAASRYTNYGFSLGFWH